MLYIKPVVYKIVDCKPKSVCMCVCICMCMHGASRDSTSRDGAPHGGRSESSLAFHSVYSVS